MYPDEFLQGKLNERRKDNSLRQLRLPGDSVDLCSNDYLGIVKNHRLQATDHKLAPGSTGSRLLSGNYTLIEEVEKQLAVFHQAEAALIFNSGYDANIGLLSSVPKKGDTIFYDQLCHASIRDGIRLSFANAFSFAHNDLIDLEKKMTHATGTVFIVTESVFSMDGDLCPLSELISIAEKNKAHLIIDEAHATGIVGENGGGLVQQLQMQDHVFARMHSFGKALGCHGAVILGSTALCEYLINFARSLVFSTALPEQAVAMIKESYRVFPGMHAERQQLQLLIQQFQSASISYEKLLSSTPIQVVIIPGNEEVKNIAGRLQQNGLDVRAILYPTVPKGSERLRVVLHAFNTSDEVDKLVKILNKPSIT
jgi:8-amino-7-oxononanoate synthase